MSQEVEKQRTQMLTLPYKRKALTMKKKKKRKRKSSKGGEITLMCPK